MKNVHRLVLSPLRCSATRRRRSTRFMSRVVSRSFFRSSMLQTSVSEMQQPRTDNRLTRTEPLVLVEAPRSPRASWP